jgi:putative membrane protein
MAHASPSLELLGQWNLDPTILLGTALLCGAYLYTIGPLRKRYGWGPEVKRGQVVAFLVGTAIMFLALISPLDELGDEYLFSAHMVQHLLITLVAPPLWLLGTPGWLVHLLLRQPVIGRALRTLTRPPIAFFLFNSVFAAWHIPFLYDLTLSNEYIHVLEHLMFMATAVLNWWPIVNPLPEEMPRLSYGSQILYMFCNCQVMVALGVLLFLAGPLYAPYLLAPRIFGISVADDQTLGAMIMWIPGTIVYLIMMSVAFYSWFEQHEGEEDALGSEQLL